MPQPQLKLLHADLTLVFVVLWLSKGFANLPVQVEWHRVKSNNPGSRIW